MTKLSQTYGIGTAEVSTGSKALRHQYSFQIFNLVCKITHHCQHIEAAPLTFAPTDAEAATYLTSQDAIDEPITDISQCLQTILSFLFLVLSIGRATEIMLQWPFRNSRQLDIDAAHSPNRIKILKQIQPFMYGVHREAVNT